MSELNYIMIICATWYLSFCLTSLPGPRGIFAIMRGWFDVMDCIYCVSFWIGLILYGFAYVGQMDIVNVFGLVGAAHLIAAWTGANYGTQN